MNTEHDNTLLSILGKITDSLLLCLLYLLSCLPIITIGAATTALYYTTHKVPVSYTHLTLPTICSV